MTKKELISRWRIIKKNMEKRGVDAQLDMLGEYTIIIIIGTSQNLSELIEWGYEAWDDVRTCYQSRDDTHRYFAIAFKKPKGWSPDKDEEEGS